MQVGVFFFKTRMETKIKEEGKKIWVPKQAIVQSHRRKNGFFRCYGVIYIKEITPVIKSKEIIELRLYSSATGVYACVWFRMYDDDLKNPFGENELNSMTANGSGYAGRGGCDLSAAAIVEALAKCGIPYDNIRKLKGGIERTEAVLKDLAELFGYNRNRLIVYKGYE